MNSQKKIIYDFGAHNGDDIPYYLLKSDLVVAVEANPLLCEQIKSRFSQEIVEGRLIVENCVLSVERSAENVPFFIHKFNDVWSQFPCPDPVVIDQFEKVYLPSKDVIDIIKCYGDPYYIKIDVEIYDHVILKHLFLNKIFPPYLSAESHIIDVFCLFVALGCYESFKLVDGATVSAKYKDAQIQTHQGLEIYSFPHHSAGPFGNDIKGDWMTKDNFAKLLLFANLGWKDIHVSNVDRPNSAYAPSPQFLIEISIDF
jgi:FkbM family methyltransferase